MVTVQVPVPVHAPLHPANVEPASGRLSSATTVPLPKLALHVDPQLIPAGFDAMMPVPAPLLAAVSVYALGAFAAKVAVTLRAALMVT
jgi:hypothetical protein